MIRFYINDKNFFWKNFNCLVESLGRNNVEIYSPEEEAVELKLQINRGDYKVIDIFKSLLIILKTYQVKDLNIYITIIPIILGAFVSFIKNGTDVFYFTGLGTIFISKKNSFIKYILQVYFYLFLNRKKLTIIVQNKSDKEILINRIKIRRAKIYIINGCGIDLDKFKFIPKYKFKNEVSILIPARLIREKGIIECIDASKILSNKNIKHRMVFSSSIDHGNPSSLSEKEIEEYSRIDNLEFTGYVENIIDLYKESDIVCLPSYREGLPNSLLEAAAIGRLIIASDVAGCNDVIEHNYNGILFKEKDSNAIAVAVEKIILNEYKINDIINNSRIKVEEKYSDKIITSELLEILTIIKMQMDKS